MWKSTSTVFVLCGSFVLYFIFVWLFFNFSLEKFQNNFVTYSEAWWVGIKPLKKLTTVCFLFFGVATEKNTAAVKTYTENIKVIPVVEHIRLPCMLKMILCVEMLHLGVLTKHLYVWVGKVNMFPELVKLCREASCRGCLVKAKWAHRERDTAYKSFIVAIVFCTVTQTKTPQ